MPLCPNYGPPRIGRTGPNANVPRGRNALTEGDPGQTAMGPEVLTDSRSCAAFMSGGGGESSPRPSAGGGCVGGSLWLGGVVAVSSKWTWMSYSSTRKPYLRRVWRERRRYADLGCCHKSSSIRWSYFWVCLFSPEFVKFARDTPFPLFPQKVLPIFIS